MALLDSADIAAVFADNSVEDVSSVPNAPVYEWHSGTDVLIPVEAIDSTMARYCEAWVPVTSDVVSAPDHLSAAVIGLHETDDQIARSLHDLVDGRSEVSRRPSRWAQTRIAAVLPPVSPSCADVEQRYNGRGASNRASVASGRDV
ncbi:lipase family protein [Rhodococcus erythropolis]|uniref:lipase family protein n=1 Tax=Rhodococcus erythropolis TaxID=1833 RepID=UPI00294934E0|nr:lipase family protein [Rhodococcus erythropolis]MDV6211829.1 lipase family protein [Rhodococcus erythropolis]